MSSKDGESFMDRYSRADMARKPSKCHYDNLRTHGFSKSDARRIADEAGDHTKRSLDEAGKMARSGPSTSATREPVHRSVVIPAAWRDED